MKVLGEDLAEVLIFFLIFLQKSSVTDKTRSSEVETLHDGLSVEPEVEEGPGGDQRDLPHSGSVSVEAILQLPRLKPPLLFGFALLAAGPAVRRSFLHVGRIGTFTPLVRLVPLLLVFDPTFTFGPGETTLFGAGAVGGFARCAAEVLVAVGGLSLQPADPLPQRPDERNGHEEPVGRQPEFGLGRHVVPVTRQLLDGEPLDVPDLLPGLGVELGVFGHSRDDVESNQLVGDFLLDELLFTDAVLDVEASFLQHFSNRAVVRSFFLVDLPLWETPAGLGQVALNEQHVLQRFIQDDGSVGGHAHLVLLPLLQDLLYVLPVRKQERTVMENGFGEVSDPAVRSSGSVLHAEVQVEPVGQLDLKTHPDGIVPLLTGDVKDETAAKVVQNGGGYVHSFRLHVS